MVLAVVDSLTGGVAYRALAARAIRRLERLLDESSGFWPTSSVPMQRTP